MAPTRSPRWRSVPGAWPQMDADGLAAGFCAFALGRPVCFRGWRRLLHALVQAVPGDNLKRPQLVLVEVERILLGDIDARVGIPLPPAAKIDRLVDPANLILAGNRQHCGIVLAVARSEEHTSELQSPRHL